MTRKARPGRRGSQPEGPGPGDRHEPTPPPPAKPPAEASSFVAPDETPTEALHPNLAEDESAGDVEEPGNRETASPEPGKNIEPESPDPEAESPANATDSPETADGPGGDEDRVAEDSAAVSSFEADSESPAVSESIADLPPDGAPVWDVPYQIDSHHVVDTDGELLEIVQDRGPWRLWERLNGWDRRLLFSTGLVTLLGTFFYCLGLTSLSFAPSLRPRVEAAPETPTVTPSNTPIVILFEPVATETIGPTPTEAPPPVFLPPTPTEPPRRTPTPIPPPTAEPVETAPIPTATFFVPLPPLQSPVATSTVATPIPVRTVSPVAGTTTPTGASPTRPAGSPSVVASVTGTRAPATTASPITGSATVPPSATRPPTSPVPPSPSPILPTNTPAVASPTATRPPPTATTRPP